MKIEDFDKWVVRIENRFLVAVAYEDTGMCRLSISPYDAAQIDALEDAAEIARRIGGRAVRFNRITGVIGT